MPSNTVTNNTSAGQFELQTPAGLALLKYLNRDNALHLVHTEVPKQAEGQGFGGALAKAALEHARAQKLEVVPSCAFVKAYLARNPEYASLVKS